MTLSVNQSVNQSARQINVRTDGLFREFSSLSQIVGQSQSVSDSKSQSASHVPSQTSGQSSLPRTQ